MAHNSQLRDLSPSILTTLREGSVQSQNENNMIAHTPGHATANLELEQGIIGSRYWAEGRGAAAPGAGLAHELNQLLGAIANYANGCLRRLDSAKADKQALMYAFLRIAEQVERAGKISHCLRSFINCNEPEIIITDLNLLLREVVSLEPVDQGGHSGCERRLCVPRWPGSGHQKVSTPSSPLRAKCATVYLVDDDKSMRESLSFLLEALGWEVRLFISAQDFLAHYSPPLSPACLLLEVRMSGMSGLDLQAVLKEYGIELPAIMITACADVPMVVRAMHQGAVDFLEKPFTEQQLRDCVEKAVVRDSDRQRTHEQRQEIHNRLARLTPREHEVMRLVVRGLLNKQIASELALSMKTVEQHRARVMEKMEADSLASLVRMALASGAS